MINEYLNRLNNFTCPNFDLNFKLVKFEPGKINFLFDLGKSLWLLPIRILFRHFTLGVNSRKK